MKVICQPNQDIKFSDSSMTMKELKGMQIS